MRHIHALLVTLTLLLLLVACGGTTDREDAPCPTEAAPDASTPDTANVVDSCVSNVHSDFLCARAELPTAYTAIDCHAIPKKMHVESGTLLIRSDGRDGCIEQTVFGELATCCPVCAPGRVVCLASSGLFGCCPK